MVFETVIVMRATPFLQITAAYATGYKEGFQGQPRARQLNHK